MKRSYYEATARQRLAAILDARSFEEFLPPGERVVSPHLQALDLPVAFDDGVIVGRGAINAHAVLIAAQEGGFIGGAVGEVHGAKIAGILERAVDEYLPVVLLAETGGVRLQEANAGLIAVSEIMRAILRARSAGIPVVCAIGGQYGCFGGMAIALACCSTIIMSEEGRFGLSGPEVIETARGVEEFDSRDRALVWRTVGGKHRYLLGDCGIFVDDDLAAFRHAITLALAEPGELTLARLEREHALLSNRLERFGALSESREIWRLLGWSDPSRVPLAATSDFLEQAADRRAERDEASGGQR